MGRCATTTEAIPSMGEVRTLRAPKIYYFNHRHAEAPTDWAGHIARAANLGFDCFCIAPPFAPARDDPFLIADLDSSNPKLGIEGSSEQVVGRIASMCAT